MNLRLALSIVAATAGAARADAPPDTTTQPAAPVDPDAELRAMAAQQELHEESIEIFDRRPTKAFDRDTELRLTGEQLAARGATDLGSALALLPDVSVRDAGRGGFNLDVRGARKGSVAILIDGVAVTDPFYGTFDVSTIPITDIVQIRVATTPQSPIDGPGGPGGVVEVLTRDAIGPQLVIARLTADSAPSFGVTGTARAALARHWALRVSASGLAGARAYAIPRHTLGEDRHAATGAMRLEYRDGDRRVALDGFVDDRHYIAPPADTGVSDILMIDRETSTRASLKADDKLGDTQVQAQAWVHRLARRTVHFADYTLESPGAIEDLRAWRTGGLALVTRPITRDARWAVSTAVDRDSAHVGDSQGRAAVGAVTLLEVAGDLQYERTGFRVDGAVGGAVPFGVDAAAWPEAKLVAHYRPHPDLELVATAARKGRVPTLRERFDLSTGNPALRPELASVAELRAIYTRADAVRIELAPYARRTANTIRQIMVDPANQPGVFQQANLDRVSIYGVDAQARVRAWHDEHGRAVEVGGSVAWIHARSNSADPVLAMTPLDRLPAVRADAWLQVTPDRHVSVLARARYFGTTLDQTAPLGAYTLVELTATMPLARGYLAVIRATDLGNVAPETRAGYHDPGRTVFATLQATWE